MAASMLTRNVAGVILVVHAPVAPSDRDWQLMVDVVEQANPFLGMVVLVAPDCPGPNAAQRKKSSTLWKSTHQARGALITSSILHRGILTAMRWLVAELQFKGFAPAEWRSALEFVCPTKAKWPALCAVAVAMVEELGVEDAFSHGPWIPPSAWRISAPA